MTEENSYSIEENSYSIEERISFALQWLGLEDIVIGKHFNVDKFLNKDKEVLDCEISYNNTEKFIPDKAAKSIVYILERVMDYKNRKESSESPEINTNNSEIKISLNIQGE